MNLSKTTRILIIWMLTSSGALSQTPWKEFSTSKYELTFYNSEASSFDNARLTCQNIGADLIQLYDINVRNKFYEIISQVPKSEYCWIGVTGTMFNWNWLNGRKVDLNLNTWKPGQPDNHEGNENRMIYYPILGMYNDISNGFQYAIPTCQRERVIKSGIHTLTLYRFDEDGNSYARNYDSAKSACYSQQSRLAVITENNKAAILTFINDRPAETYWVYGKTLSKCFARKGTAEIRITCTDSYYYVCEQVQTNSIFLQPNSPKIVLPSQITIICAAAGNPFPNVEWTRNNNNVSTSANNSVYQIKTTGRSVLDLKKTTVTDEDKYTCFATNSIGGSPFSQNKQVQVIVPSTPTINKVTANACDSSLVIEWKPHHRAIGIKHRIRFSKSGSKISDIYVTPVDDSTLNVTTGNLSSTTQYNITIEPCSNTGRCYKYLASKTYTTGGGIPNSVTNAVLNKTSEECMVSWNLPKMTIPSYITRFKLLVVSSFAQHPVGGNATVYKSNKFIGSSVFSYTIQTFPNRIYNVSIQAETCAGVGQSTVAAGTCVTELGAPSFLLQPQSNNSISDNGTLDIVIQTPDESNGQIRCVFLVVQIIDDGINRSKTIFNEQYIGRLNSVSLKDEYIAIAIDRQRIKSKKTIFILGDNSLTVCKIETKNASNRTKRETTEDFYVGTNKQLNKDLSYSIYMVTATPSETETYFKTSDALTLMSHRVSTTNETKENTTAFSFLPQRQSKSYISDNGTLEIIIQTPDDSNHQIRCVFLVVKVIDVSTNLTKPVFNEQYLRRLSSVSLKDEYITIAIDRQRMKSNKTIFMLGDNSLTVCKIETKNERNKKKRETTEYFYVGTNKQLNKDLSYNIYMVAVTSSETEIYFKINDVLSLMPQQVSASNKTKENITEIIVSSVAGIVFFALLVMALVFMRRRNSIVLNNITLKDETNEQHKLPNIYDVPTMKLDQQKVDDIISVPATTNDESTYERMNDICSTTCHENAVYENQQVENPYEAATS